jgi:threonine dehydrogenase-like Zn-dependent dehydrogenase
VPIYPVPIYPVPIYPVTARSTCGRSRSHTRPALELGAVDHAREGSDEELTDLLDDGAEASVDRSGSGAGRFTALRHTRRWGRAALVGVTHRFALADAAAAYEVADRGIGGKIGIIWPDDA